MPLHGRDTWQLMVAVDYLIQPPGEALQLSVGLLPVSSGLVMSLPPYMCYMYTYSLILSSPYISSHCPHHGRLSSSNHVPSSADHRAHQWLAVQANRYRRMASSSQRAHQRTSGSVTQQEVSHSPRPKHYAKNISLYRIEDPFLGFNELKCEWVGEKSWTYRVALPPAHATNEGTKDILAFDGLDTFATVKLNSETILKSDNMWIMHRIDVTDKLRASKESVLEIEFAPALFEARKIKDAHPEHKWVGFNGDMARLAVRKAQYHWGWDWGRSLFNRRE